MTGDYEQAGVRGQEEALSSVVRHLGPTLGFPEDVETLTTFGQYASVLKVTDELAIAISTDGVGSKTIIASTMDRYDTIGYDCVAMNVNDVICVGARPFAMVDYLGVHTLDSRRADEILRGLGGAAKEAEIAIPGGELAQLPEVIGSDGRSPGDEKAFDLVGTCIGTVHPDRVVLGRDVTAGRLDHRDRLLRHPLERAHPRTPGAARRVRSTRLDETIDALGRTLGEELLEPTEIYVRAVTALWNEGHRNDAASLTSRATASPTSAGSMRPVGYDITTLPEVPAIFETHPGRGRDRPGRDVPRLQHGGRLRHDRDRHADEERMPRGAVLRGLRRSDASEPSPTKPGASRCDLWDLWVGSRTEPATSLPRRR